MLPPVSPHHGGDPPGRATLPAVSPVFLQVHIFKLLITLVLERKFPAGHPQLPCTAPIPPPPSAELPWGAQPLGAMGSDAVGAGAPSAPRDRNTQGEDGTGEAKNPPLQ